MKEPIEIDHRTDLTAAEAEAGVESIIAGVDPCQAAAFLVALRAKGETSQEVAGMVTAMRRHMIAVKPTVGPCVDIVGTGGDGHHTVNFSTAASVVAAACGAKVAKHGNRSVSSMCGSADVLEELGVKLARRRRRSSAASPTRGSRSCSRRGSTRR